MVWNPMLRKRAQAELEERRARSSTFTEPLINKGDEETCEFLLDFYHRVYEPSQRAQYTEELKKYPFDLEQHFEFLVKKGDVSYEDFWQRYEYRCNLDRITREIQKGDAEAARKSRNDSLQSMKKFFGDLQTAATTPVVPATPTKPKAPATPSPSMSPAKSSPSPTKASQPKERKTTQSPPPAKSQSIVRGVSTPPASQQKAASAPAVTKSASSDSDDDRRDERGRLDASVVELRETNSKDEGDVLAKQLAAAEKGAATAAGGSVAEEEALVSKSAVPSPLRSRLITACMVAAVGAGVAVIALQSETVRDTLLGPDSALSGFFDGSGDWDSWWPFSSSSRSYGGFGEGSRGYSYRSERADTSTSTTLVATSRSQTVLQRRENPKVHLFRVMQLPSYVAAKSTNWFVSQASQMFFQDRVHSVRTQTV